MRKIIHVVFTVFLIFGIVSACNKSTPDLSENTGDVSLQNPGDSPENSYWKAVEINSGGNLIDEFWSDLFLWKDGAGCFRFSQASAESNYYGMREIVNCGWSQDNGKLTLKDKAQGSSGIHTGVIEQNRMVITYSSYYLHKNVTVTMERAQMPPYGTQWEIPDHGYPLSFTAEYEWIGIDVPLSEPQGFFSPKTPD